MFHRNPNCSGCRNINMIVVIFADKNLLIIRDFNSRCKLWDITDTLNFSVPLVGSIIVLSYWRHKNTIGFSPNSLLDFDSIL